MEGDETWLNESDARNRERQDLAEANQTNTNLVRRIERRFKSANLSHDELYEALGGSCLCYLCGYLFVTPEILERTRDLDERDPNGSVICA